DTLGPSGATFTRFDAPPPAGIWGIGMVTDGPGLEGTATLAPPRSATAMSGPPGSAVTAWSAPLTIPRALAARTWENFACAGAGAGFARGAGAAGAHRVLQAARRGDEVGGAGPALGHGLSSPRPRARRRLDRLGAHDRRASRAHRLEHARRRLAHRGVRRAP